MKLVLEPFGPRRAPSVKGITHQSFFQCAGVGIEKFHRGKTLGLCARLDDYRVTILDKFPLFDFWQLGMNHAKSFSVAQHANTGLFNPDLDNSFGIRRRRYASG